MKKFNDKQKLAINSLEGYIRIIAGAGSGKTTVLTHRYMKLLEKGVAPQNILCLTFTNKAAEEMKTRVEKMSGKIKNALICTFHSFCLRVLRESINKLGFATNFGILDGEDQKTILKNIYKKNKIEFDTLSYLEAFRNITHLKIVEQKNILDFACMDNSIKKLYNKYRKNLKNKSYYNEQDQDLIYTIYYGYLYEQQKICNLDFNDLLVLTVLLFKNDSDVLNKWQEKLLYIMVDEFQDTSYIQNELINLLSNKHKNLFVVGDPDQTIYSWRGAEPEILVDFDKKHKDTTTIILDENYRSTPNILGIANELIAKNKLRVPKNLYTKHNEGKQIIYKHFNHPSEEADWIIKCIKSANKQGRKYGDCTILYRMHFLSRFVEEALIRNSIPYVIYSGTNFYERKEIKDVLAYLKLIDNPNDDLSLERIINVPARKIGKKTMDEIKNYADKSDCILFKAVDSLSKNNNSLEDFVMLISLLRKKSTEMKLSDFVFELIKVTGYEKFLKQETEQERFENVMELIKSIREYEKNEHELNLSSYLQNIMLLTNTDKSINKDCVTLMTIHSAKGLEFPIVFVCGMSEGYFPCKQAQSDAQMEEERRLAYVAYTRAKEVLCLSNSNVKDFEGNEIEPSRFLYEVDKNHYADPDELPDYESEKEMIRVEDLIDVSEW